MNESNLTRAITPDLVGERIAEAVNSLIAVGSGRVLLANVENGPTRVENAVCEAIASAKAGIEVLRGVWSFHREELSLIAPVDAQITTFNPDLIVICTDFLKDELLSHLNSLVWRNFPKVVTYGMGHQDVFSQRIGALERGNAEASHATGYARVKEHIFNLLESLRRRRCAGLVVELGVFRGGTLLLIKQMLKALDFTEARLLGFDTFNGFPPPRCLLDMFAMDEFVNRDFSRTSSLLAAEAILLVRGDIVETIARLDKECLLLTFIDTDNYSPAAAALPVCWKNTIRGGAVIMDHFYTKEEFSDTIGERIAAWEFFKDQTDVLHLSGTGVFIKI